MCMGLLLGVIGNPAKHSFSPWMQGEFLKRAGINGIYRAYEIQEPDLPMFMKVFRTMEIDGFNITIPYKQEIMKYVDQLDESAEKIGAVNTVVLKSGKWIGYNTDGIGYVQSLHYQYPFFFQHKSTKKILILGAGGAARGIYYALNNAGFLHIDIANRTIN